MNSQLSGNSLSITLGSQSPLFTYLPQRDGPEISGWNASYSGTTHAAAYGGGVGVGTAFRETQLDGASIGLTFDGSSIYFCLGFSSYPATSQLTVDGNSTTYQIAQRDSSDTTCSMFEGSDAIVYVGDLADGPHDVSLSVSLGPGGDYARFYGALPKVTAGTPGSSMAMTTASYKDPGWTWSPVGGHWEGRVDYNLFNNSQAVGDLEGGSMWAHVYNPVTIGSYTISNATAFYVLGPVGPRFANYTVAFNGANTTFAPTNYFSAYQQILYFAGGLDPTQQYELQMQDWDAANPAGLPGVTFMAIDALVMVKPSSLVSAPAPSGEPASGAPSCASCRSTNEQGGSSDSSHSPIAAIVGGVVGGLVLVSLIAVLLLWKRLRRCMHRGRLDMASEETPLRHNRSHSTQAQPYRLSQVVLPHGTSFQSNQRPLVAIRTDNLPHRPMSTDSVISISPRWTEKQPPSSTQNSASPLALTTPSSRTYASPVTAASSRPDLLHAMPLHDIVSHLNERLQRGQPGTSWETMPPGYETE